MRILLIRTLNGEELIQELKEIYNSLNKLEKVCKRNPDNMKTYSDLDDWKYYQDHPNEVIEEVRGIVTEKLILGKLEMKIINFIKYKKPESINELARKFKKM